MLAELNSDQSEARDAVNLNTEVRQEGQASAELAAAQSAIISLRTDIVQLTSEITKQNRQLNGFEGEINELADFALYLHPIDMADSKYLHTISPLLGALLEKLLAFRNKDLSSSASNNQNSEFTSPAFAGYILQQVRGVPASDHPDAFLTTLDAGKMPQLGDLIQYEMGLAMFILRDRRGSPFVIGMTPVGVLALNPAFSAKQTGVLRTGLYKWPSLPSLR